MATAALHEPLDDDASNGRLEHDERPAPSPNDRLAAVLRAISGSDAWKAPGVLWKADPALAAFWWTIVVLRGLLPAIFGIAIGVLVGAVDRDANLTVPLGFVSTIFMLLEVIGPIHQAVSASLGDKTADWLHDQLAQACIEPPGMAHLEDPKLTSDLTTARDFDLGMTAPPVSISMDFIAGSLVELVGGLTCVGILAGYSIWAAMLLGFVWMATHWLLRESAIWQERNTDKVRAAQRDAEYTYRLAVDPPAAKELRLFGLVDWTIERFVERRTLLHDLQYHATRLRERPLAWSIVLVIGGNTAVFSSLASAVIMGAIDLGGLVIYAMAAIGSSTIAFGGMSWALDGVVSPIAAVLRLAPDMAREGALPSAGRPASTMPARAIRFRNVTFGYPGGAGPVLDGFDVTIPAGSSLAIVGQNGAGKTTLAKLLCRLYDPQAGTIEIDGVDLRTLDVESWRSRITAVFQDFIRFERPLRENVAPRGAPDRVVVASLASAGAAQLANLSAVLARGYDGGTELSGGQWQRVALARALCAVELGAGVVLLDEPTSQLHVRGEAEIFNRVLNATRACTTILISHRFSTVRHADKICVLEQGKVVELGSHEELMALGGRYRTMFDLQAQRFGATEDEEGVAYDVLA